jgi:hypothetical protein
MTTTDLTRKQRNATILGLIMALGPLTALSFGSKYADEETLARANAGRDAIEAREMLASGVEGNPVTSSVEDATAMPVRAGG